MVDNYSFEQEKVPIYRQSAAALKFRPCEKMIEMKKSDCKHSYFPDYQSSSSHICSCGYFAGSLAIMTDAAHLLTDLASFLISLFSMYVASRPATRRMSFGWHRAEVLGALVSVILIWVITGILVYIAIERLIYKTFDIDAKVMMITAAVGVLVNLMQVE
ncbi:hypothetical protein D917_02610 [Trichinella nativa]|uniref:Cation efflux protein transmembrane domain-containing protein n=1 Tax=Trichinella nativa TaxID=6335 RepID=A0A1Y3EHC2_9BILA|nr:hypothetical protein D917_02610 [Trichinella nativa]